MNLKQFLVKRSPLNITKKNKRVKILIGAGIRDYIATLDDTLKVYNKFTNSDFKDINGLFKERSYK